MGFLKSTDLFFLKEVLRKSYTYLNYSDIVEMSLSESSIKRILLEELEEDELKKLEDLAKETKTQTDELIKDAEALGFENSVKYMKALLEDIPDTPDLVSLSLTQDPEKVAEEVGKVAAVTKKANAFRASFTKAMSLFGTELSKLDLSDDVDKSQSIKDLMMAEIEGFPDEKTLRTGAEKAFEPPEVEKGVFAKIAGFFGFGDELSKKQFADDVFDAKFADVIAKSEELKADTSDAESDAAASEEASENVQSDVESLSTGDAEALPDDAAGPTSGERPTPGGSPEEDAAAATTATETAAAEAENKPFGTALMDVVGAFAEPYKDDEAVMDSIDKLRLDMRDAFKGRRDDMKGAFKNRFKDWFSGLDDEAKAQVAPEAVEGIAGAFTNVVDDHLKFESIQQRFDDFLNEDLILNPEHTKADSKLEDKYTEEDMIAYRMNKLAGLE